jgi:hypothetical protein
MKFPWTKKKPKYYKWDFITSDNDVLNFVYDVDTSMVVARIDEYTDGLYNANARRGEWPVNATFTNVEAAKVWIEQTLGVKVES